jgi:hypothetical protein
MLSRPLSLTANILVRGVLGDAAELAGSPKRQTR